MKAFHVYTHPEKGAKAIKLGFSFPSFFFGIIWAIVKQLWWLLGVYIGLMVVTWVLDVILISSTDYETYLVISMLISFASLGFHVFVATQANRWLEEDLIKRGYTKQGLITAHNNEHAVSLFLGGQSGAGQSQSPSDRPRNNDDNTGTFRA
ncbi:hypothetical protein CAI21_04425 [Alkalilimnicola ehrlichii]|uniref:DUF2628 domain-containing protein n=1 Tax=Alkalilimnicola ehrlichii TaxID=351052 RepID=A0A3E0WZ72_9GAMM|nr:DUF2628 domain-containing protein [Alkalilimnicola ehrlichii]RFA30760.1 hypothetical protein CAI21_04425 [Alkalilimnicola ehrlichii]RFA38336.1 hypothetical protein CAL65_05790 [Alkalilimnicola ehrlichii]